MMTPHSRRVLKTIAAGLFVLLLAGVTYQGVATALERRSFKYPGRLVPVGDHQLHIHCIGSGTPTVVLEAPALGFSESWGYVQPALADTTRVCAYDRAGLGWSEASDGPFDAQAVPDELHQLLAGAEEKGPFVLVGDGLGAAYATEFAAAFPQDAAALLLVAPAHGEPGAGMKSLRASPSPWLARVGILRLSLAFARRSATLPGPPGGAVSAFSLRPDHLTRAGQEARQQDAVLARAATVTVPDAVRVRRLDSVDRQSMLGTPESARAIVDAASELVRAVRERH